MKIEWFEFENSKDDGTYDLCGKFNGKYVDVVRKFNNTWSIHFNNVKIEGDITSREEAKQKITKFLE